MIFSIDEHRNRGEAHLIDGKTLAEIYGKVAGIINRDKRFDTLHFRKYNYYGNIKAEMSRKCHTLRREQS